MALSDDQRAEMQDATREAAIVLCEDLRHFRSILLNNSPRSEDVRRISVTLRRILLDGHLHDVAAARVGRVAIQAPDYREAVTTAEGQFVTVGLAPMFGWENRVFDVYRTFPGPDNENFLQLAGSAPAMQCISIGDFMRDKIARLDSHFVTRGEILKFVCYQAFGAHYKGKEKPSFRHIRRFRRSATFARNEDGKLVLSVGNLDRVPAKPYLMDLLHAHLFATAYFLVTSPDVVALETLIAQEIAPS